MLWFRRWFHGTKAEGKLPALAARWNEGMMCELRGIYCSLWRIINIRTNFNRSQNERKLKNELVEILEDIILCLMTFFKLFRVIKFQISILYHWDFLKCALG